MLNETFSVIFKHCDALKVYSYFSAMKIAIWAEIGSFFASSSVALGSFPRPILDAQGQRRGRLSLRLIPFILVLVCTTPEKNLYLWKDFFFSQGLSQTNRVSQMISTPELFMCTFLSFLDSGTLHVLLKSLLRLDISFNLYLEQSRH